jgi:hypothetical protein
VFKDDHWYPDKQIAETFAISQGTIFNWRRDFGFPPGELFGRVRRELGKRINDWIAKRPRDKAVLAPGMGGHGRGRPRKIPAPDKQAAPAVAATP